MPEGTEGQGEGNTPPQAPPAAPEKPAAQFTQEQVDAILADRLTRERTKFADYDALKTKAAAFDAAEAAKQTELERAQAAQAASEAKANEAMAKANGTLKRASILAAAAGAKAADAETVVALLVNDESITVDEAGNVAGVEAAVKKLLKDKPFLVAQTGAPKSGGEFGGSDEQGIDAQIAEAEKKGDWMTASALKLQKAGGIPQI